MKCTRHKKKEKRRQTREVIATNLDIKIQVNTVNTQKRKKRFREAGSWNVYTWAATGI